MKKTITILSAGAMALMLAMPTAVQAQSRLQLTEKAQGALRVSSQVLSSVTPTHLKVNKAQTQEDILIDEDFSYFTAGTMSRPDTTKYIASQYYEPGIYIDPSLTKDGTWIGDGVFSAGGAAYLWSPNPQGQSFISTPLGDYSGDLVITCKAKALTPWVVTGVNEDGSYHWGVLSGSGLGIQVRKGGYGGDEFADTDDSPQTSIRLYEGQGWTRLTMTIRNYSADNDGFICFYSNGAVLIDDIQVTTQTNFIASPKLNGVTDFQKDQFTISWQPVRKAYNYYVDFYKKVYLSDEEGLYQEGFEEALSEEWVSTSSTISDNEGADDTKGLVLHNGDSITTPNNGATYKEANLFIRLVDPTIDKSDPYWKWSVNGRIYLDALTEAGWKQIGYFNASWFVNGDVCDLTEEMDEFAHKYYAVRFCPQNLSEGAYFVFDNINIATNRPSKLEFVEGERSMYNGEGDNYTFYDMTNATEYTFTNLDPETEYFYGVRSHYVTMFSQRALYHAFNVCAPEAKEATDIDMRGSFTANWEAAPKATGYNVNLYGVYRARTDVEDFTIMEEDFDKIDDGITSATSLADAEYMGNYRDTSLDDFTMLPGWIGNGNIIAQGMLGCEEVTYYSNIIKTPAVYVGNGDKVRITLKVWGYAKDGIVLRIEGQEYSIAFQPVGSEGWGVIDGYVDVPVSSKTIQPVIYASEYYPFVIDYIRFSQDLKAGDIVYSWLQSASTDNETFSYTFNNLSDYDFNLFGYEVTSTFELEGQTTTSQPSELMLVSFDDTPTEISQPALRHSFPEEYYTVDGRRMESLQSGLNIVRMKDGSVRKIIRR